MMISRSITEQFGGDTGSPAEEIRAGMLEKSKEFAAAGSNRVRHARTALYRRRRPRPERPPRAELRPRAQFGAGAVRPSARRAWALTASPCGRRVEPRPRPREMLRLPLGQARVMAGAFQETGLVGTLVEMELIADGLQHRSVATTIETVAD